MHQEVNAPSTGTDQDKQSKMKLTCTIKASCKICFLVVDEYNSYLPYLQSFIDVAIATFHRYLSID